MDRNARSGAAGTSAQVGWNTQARTIADAVHNLPRLLAGLEPTWTLEDFERMFLNPLLAKYPELGRTYPEFAIGLRSHPPLVVHKGKGHERYVIIVPHPAVAAKFAKMRGERKARS